VGTQWVSKQFIYKKYALIFLLSNSLGARGSGSKHPLGLPPPANTDFQNSPLQGCTLRLRLLVAFFIGKKCFKKKPKNAKMK
jgi:hypothetical protein